MDKKETDKLIVYKFVIDAKSILIVFALDYLFRWAWNYYYTV